MHELIVRFDGDWRIGTGAGLRGELDERVRRDPTGLPVLPGRTLTGMWRDGCERVAAALDAGRTGSWQDWVAVLFGSQPHLPGHDHAPTSATLSVRTATLSPGLHAALRNAPQLAAALYSVRPGVSLVSATHYTRDKHLRMVETTRGGLTLRGPVTLADDGWTLIQRHTALVLLVLGATEIRAIGGGRRRGLGRCTVTLSDVDDAVRALLAADTPPEPASVPQTQQATEPATAMSAGETVDWVTVRLRVTCVDPLLSRAVATDTEVRGLPYVPGARLLPVVAAKAQAVGLDVRQLVDTGGIICQPLVPEVDNEAARPAPRCLAGPKRATVDALLTNQLLAPAPAASKPVRDKWVAGFAHSQAVLFQPALEVQLHMTVADTEQRPTTEVGGLYSYQSIPAGSVLIGRTRLRCSASQAAEVVAAMNGRWSLGASRKDDYGRVRVEASIEESMSTVVHRDRDVAVVWLLTDTVLVDDTLAPVTTVDGVVSALGAALGHELTLIAPDEGKLSHAVAFGRMEGWQTRWTRPRPSLIAVAAGSVLAVRRRDRLPIPGAALDALERDGLGERRVEGLGRVVVNDPMLEAPTLKGTPPPPRRHESVRPEQQALDDAEQRLLDQIRHTAVRRDIEARAAGLDRAKLGALADTTPSQRGVLRAVLREAMTASDPRAVLTRFLATVTGTTVRANRWSRRTVVELRRLVEDGGVWDSLGIEPDGRIAELETWALRRLLAHLDGGRQAKARQGGAVDGA